MMRALLCLVAFHTTALVAQAPSFVGNWQLSYPAGVRNENGDITVLYGTGLLSIAAQGDSLIGTLTPDPSPDLAPRPASRLAAPASAGEAAFVSYSAATINLNGNISSTTVVNTWRLVVRGDSLVGTVERKMQGYDLEGGNQPPQLVSGTRRKG